MKKIILFVLMLGVAGTLFAQTFAVNGINYNVTSPTTVEVGLNPDFTGAAVIPSSVINASITYSVTSIGGNAFYGSSITSVDLARSVTSINEGAFAFCSILQEVRVHWYSPLSINANVFNGLVFANAHLVIPTGTRPAYRAGPIWKDFGVVLYTREIFTVNGINYIETSPTTADFGINRQLEGDVIIPDSIFNAGYVYEVTGAAEDAFSFFFIHPTLTSVSIPNSVKIIKDRAFRGCTGLTSLNLPHSLASIGSEAFLNCTGLTTVNIPNSVTNIYGGAFSSCNSLKSVIVNWSIPILIPLDSLAFNIFDTALILYVPFGTKAAYKAAPGWKDFGTIIEMQPITFTNNGINFKVTSPTTVEISTNPSFTGVLNIPSSITYEGITYNVTSIVNNAFAGSGITSINIPNSIITIGDYAFANLTGLTAVTVNWTNPLVINANVFGNLPVALATSHTPIKTLTANKTKPVVLASTNIASVTLYVPATTLAAYKAAPVWKNFGTIIEQVTLPLTLTNFTAKATTTGNQINWATANVINVKNIILERSGTDKNFSYLVTLPITATQYIDTNPLASDNYYRLSTTDNDDSPNTYSQIAFVKGLNSEITFYPNPITNGVLNIVAGSAKLQSVVLFDLNGKKVVLLNSLNSHNKVVVSTQGLSKGVYLLEISSEKSKIVKKVVVN